MAQEALPMIRFGSIGPGRIRKDWRLQIFGWQVDKVRHYLCGNASVLKSLLIRYYLYILDTTYTLHCCIVYDINLFIIYQPYLSLGRNQQALWGNFARPW